MEVKEIIDRIHLKEDGCKFYKADLHIHTPASTDFKGEATPKDIIDTSLEKGLDIIAITDHNSVGWCEKVIDASKGRGITVMPGVEISTQGGKLGLHFTAIFDTKKPIQEIKDCLARIGIDSKKQGNEESIASESIENILKVIRQCDGIVVGAHAYSAKGICNGMKGKQRTEIIQNKDLCAIEINDLKYIATFDGSDSEYKRLLTCIKSSDAHQLSDIGKDFTLIKMEKPGIEGLRQAFCDPESRIKFDPSKIHNHPSIIGMCVEGGFLDSETFHFNENMNSLIGGKGTGKTTAVELIRFALFSPHKNDKLRKEYEEMIENVLHGGCVSLFVKTKDNQKYLVVRKIGEEPKIFRENGDQLEIKIDNFYEFFDIECYSQGELFCIAKDSTNQLKMIDKYICFDTLNEEEKTLVEKLISNSNLIIHNNGKIEELQIKTERLPSIIEKIRIIEQKGLKEHSESQKKWEYEKTVLKRIIETIKGKILEVEKSNIFTLDDINIEPDRIITQKILSDCGADYSETSKDLLKKREELLKYLIEQLSKVESMQKTWNDLYAEQLESFKEMAEELKSKDIDVDHYLELEGERNSLEVHGQEIIKRKKENESLLKERTGLLTGLFTVRNKISEKRKNEIDKINEKLKDTLHISLEKESNIEEYCEWLIDCLKGSRLQKEETKILCQKMNPTLLFDTIQNKRGDCIDILSSKTGISKSYFEKLITHQLFLNKLFELQIIKLEDALEIKLNDNGWKSLSNLSAGGKCTAILLIAMLERTTPLIVDQPEDSLDNSFVYKSVVKTIRALKDKRQMIIVTHNANIPVLGDCELMFIMNSNGLKGDIRDRGVIDSKDIKETVQIILEGGEEAFRKRREKYGI